MTLDLALTWLIPVRMSKLCPYDTFLDPMSATPRTVTHLSCSQGSGPRPTTYTLITSDGKEEVFPATRDPIIILLKPRPQEVQDEVVSA